jgi:hypothetical protein
MKSTLSFPAVFKNREFSPAGLNIGWAFLAVSIWTYRCLPQGGNEIGFSTAVWGKGILILAAAFVVYQLVGRKSLFLAMFPLAWMALSKFQLELCQSQGLLWVWPVLFAAVFTVISSAPDGAKLLPGLIPFWAAQAVLLPQSFLLPLGFLGAEKGRFKNSNWIRWGGLTAGILFLILGRGWSRWGWNWMDLYDLLVTDAFIAFFILGFLGAASFSAKGTARFAVLQGGLLTAGFFFSAPLLPLNPAEIDVLRWVFVFLSAYGLESFRTDLMDPSWHGRAVWFAVGFGLCWGVA